MVKVIVVANMTKVKKAVPRIEEKLAVHFTFGRGSVSIKGKADVEYMVDMIVRAIDFGFDLEDALLLMDPEFILEFIDIKAHTRRSNLKDVRSRVIGTDGKVLKAFENLAGAALFLRDNTIGIIVDSDHLDSLTQAVESLIRGAKHGNVFMYMEKQNAKIRTDGTDDLGLKNEDDYALLNDMDEGEMDEELDEHGEVDVGDLSDLELDVKK
ncbi:MAG: KH domain-containing protein [Patescibacteria group bacterium]|jgi:KH domain-containing protein